MESILGWFAIPSTSGSCFVRTLYYDLFFLGGPAWHGSRVMQALCHNKAVIHERVGRNSLFQKDFSHRGGSSLLAMDDLNQSLGNIKCQGADEHFSLGCILNGVSETSIFCGLINVPPPILIPVACHFCP